MQIGQEIIVFKAVIATIRRFNLNVTIKRYSLIYKVGGRERRGGMVKIKLIK